MTSKPRKKKSSLSVLRLEGELTIFRAAELKALLRSEPVAQAIDLSGISEIDTAGVQLLLMARKSAESDRRTLQLLAPSPPVQEVFGLLDLAGALGLPEDPVLRPAGDAGSISKPTSARP